ncbi:hypothetical protein ACFE04_000824 [Oxalis oulophora]
MLYGQFHIDGALYPPSHVSDETWGSKGVDSFFTIYVNQLKHDLRIRMTPPGRHLYFDHYGISPIIFRYSSMRESDARPRRHVGQSQWNKGDDSRFFNVYVRWNPSMVD